MNTLKKRYPPEKAAYLRSETDRLASAYVQALCAYLPAQLNQDTSYGETAKNILMLLEKIADVQQEIQDEVAPCKEEEPQSEQRITGTVVAHSIIPVEDITIINTMISRYGLEAFSLQKQATPQAAETAVVPITEAERAWMNRTIVRMQISTLSDEEGIIYVDHALLHGTMECKNETELYNLIRILVEKERVTQ